MDDGFDEVIAAIYDQRVENRGDVGFYRDLADAAPGPALELACGTGRVYLELLAAGIDADGLDASGAVLDALREKAAERDLDPDVRVADMTDFEADRSYGLVYCPFNALQHCRSIDDQVAVVERAYDALAPGGTFAFDVFVPDFERICEEYDRWHSERVEYSGAERELRTRTRIVDELRQEFRVEIRLRDGDDLLHEATHCLSLLPYEQVELLARTSPFDRWSVAGDFDGTPIEDGADLQVWTLQRAPC